MFTIGAFAMIFDQEGRVLLCHRRDMDMWNLPGGRVESGEMPDEAVIREVQEETGLTVEIERLVGIYGKRDKDELVFSFICRTTGGQITVTDEASECRYFEVENLPGNTSPKQVERVHDAIISPEKPLLVRQTAPSTQELLQQPGKIEQSGE